jgi:hypothetical protein
MPVREDLIDIDVIALRPWLLNFMIADRRLHPPLRIRAGGVRSL